MPETPVVDVNNETAFRTYMLTQLGRLEGAMTSGFESMRENCARQYAGCLTARERIAAQAKLATNGFGHVTAEMDAAAKVRARIVKAGVFALKYVAPPLLAALLAVLGIRGTDGDKIPPKAIAQIVQQVETAMKEAQP